MTILLNLITHILAKTEHKRLSEEELRAEYWTRIVWPATWNHIVRQSRY